MKIKFLPTLLLFTALLAPFAIQAQKMNSSPSGPALKWLIQPEYDELTWYHKGVAVAQKDGAYGLVNTKGKVLIPFEYSSVNGIGGPILGFNNENGFQLFFTETGAAVNTQIYDEIVNAGNATITKRKEVYGVLDAKGKYILPEQFSLIIHQDPYFIAIKDGKSGAYDATGKLVIPHEWQTLLWLEMDKFFQATKNSNSTVKVSTYENDEPVEKEMPKPIAYLLDAKGEIIFSGNYEQVFLLGKNTCVACNDLVWADSYDPYYPMYGDYNSDTKCYLFKLGNTQPQNKTPVQNITQAINEEQQFWFVKENKFGLMGIDGKVLLEAVYDFPSELQDGYYLLSKDERWGYVNAQYKEVIPFKYLSAFNFTKGYAQVSDESGSYLINSKGEKVLEKEYDQVLQYQNGFAVVSSNGFLGVLQMATGKMVFPLQADSLSINDAGNLILRKNKIARYALHDLSTGKALTDCILIDPYMSLMSTDIQLDGVAPLAVKLNTGEDRYFLIDKTGKALTGPVYETIEGFYGAPVCRVSRDNTYGVLDKSGNRVIPLGFEDLIIDETEQCIIASMNGYYGVLPYPAAKMTAPPKKQ